MVGVRRLSNDRTPGNIHAPERLILRGGGGGRLWIDRDSYSVHERIPWNSLIVIEHDARMLCCGRKMTLVAEAGDESAWRQLWRCTRCERPERIGWISGEVWGLPIPVNVCHRIAQEFRLEIARAYRAP